MNYDDDDDNGEDMAVIFPVISEQNENRKLGPVYAFHFHTHTHTHTHPTNI